MLCKIAGLITEIPAEGGMASRCRDYLYEGTEEPQIVIRTEDYRPERWSAVSHEGLCYMDSGLIFYVQLLKHDGLMLHSSAIELDGKAYLFSGDSGAGKSTHTSLWTQKFGPAARIFNDDKPALRFLDGRWYAYGTPWSGKHDISADARVPVAGIACIERAEENSIEPFRGIMAIHGILKQCNRPKEADLREKLLELLDRLITDVPVWKLKCNMDPEAAVLAYRVMSGQGERE